MSDDVNLSNSGDFLASSDARPIDWPKPSGAPVAIDTVEVLFGRGERPLEVAIATSVGAPRADDVRRLWKTRANRGAPVLLVVLHPAAGETQASVIGTEGDPAPIQGLSRGRVERIAAAALDEPNRHQAIRTLDRLLGSVSREGLTAGVINAGLFAAHELKDGVPRRPDWSAAQSRSVQLLGKTGRELLGSLGYRIEPKGPNLLALAGDTAQHAIAVVLDEGESFDRTSSRFGGVSPVSRALAQAQQERLPWVIALRRNQIRLYPADPDVGVGRKGLTETYIELDLTLLDDSDAGYLALLFSPEALAKGGSVDEILHDSAVYATDLGVRLRGRIYEDVVPGLAVAVARRMGASTETELDSAYHRTLIILFRLLFVAYAEDRGLLPFERNPRYTRNALKTYAKDFAEDPAQEFSADSTSIWEDLVQVWNAIDSGEPRWDVPAYNGGLFATDESHSDGAAVSALGLSNAEIGPALMAMLVDADAHGERGPVDFRSLSVREFGTIYEGLLESSLSIAPGDLTLDREQTYVPAREGDQVVVEAGGIYFHNASGQRKSTGSYFTKSFAVEHLLDSALEPAITEHLERVKELIDEDDTRKRAAEEFFDFRVADLAMGSGHFLVAAIDRIEARFSAFLSENPLPAIADELARLEAVAREALGEEQGLLAEIEPSLLLRRQIARRCIYGLDINLIAVELARLAIWIHTFVPGLPMSSLDHGLVHGNSLTGMGTIDETLAALDPQAQPGQFSLFSASIGHALKKSRATLLKVARASEATKQEVRQAAEEHRRALAEAEEARLLMDAAVAVRLGLLPIPIGPDDAVQQLCADDDRAAVARETLSSLIPAHFPYLFPEVFLGAHPGFSVLLGNPPWEEMHLNEDKYWSRYFPGHHAIPSDRRPAARAEYAEARPDLAAEYVRQREHAEFVREAVLHGPYPIRSGVADYYKAFAWREPTLVRTGGMLGLVLPREALSGASTRSWREWMMDNGGLRQVTNLVNRSEWAFTDVHQQYPIVLVAWKKGDAGSATEIRGRFNSLMEWDRGRDSDGLVLTVEQLRTVSADLTVPSLPSSETASAFIRYLGHPKLGDVRDDFEVTIGVDFTAAQATAAISASGQNARNPVIQGRNITFWNWNASPPTGYLDDNRASTILLSESPGLAYRQIARSNDSRTFIVAPVPSGTAIKETAYGVRIDAGGPDAALYLAAVLSSRVFDWYVRTIVNMRVLPSLARQFSVPDMRTRPKLAARLSELAASRLPQDGFDAWIGGVDRHAVEASLADAETDAICAHLYGLTQDEVEIVLNTFHPTWDHRGHLTSVASFYAQWGE